MGQNSEEYDVEFMATLSGDFLPCTEVVQVTGWIHHCSSNSQGNLLGTSSTPEEKCLLSSVALPWQGLIH